MRIPAPAGYEDRPPREWPVPGMDHSAGGVESAFTPEMGRLLLARILAGETVRQVTADPRTPSYATVYHWVRVHGDFGDAWREVRCELARRAIGRHLGARAKRGAQRRFEELAGLRPRRGPGRPSTYTPARGRAVCRAVAKGWTVSRVSATPGLPTAKAIYRWLKNEPAFRVAYVEACRQRLLDLQLRIDMVLDETTPWTLADGKRAVARLEGRIGRLTPKTYRALP